MAKIMCVDGSVVMLGGIETADIILQEQPQEILRRVSNRLTRSDSEFASTTNDVSAYPYDLMECMRILRDFIMEHHLYSNSTCYNSHVSNYVADGRWVTTNRYLNWAFESGKCFVYATRRNCPIIFSFDMNTGEIIHHAPTDARWNNLWLFERVPVFCVLTGETDPEKLVWITGRYNLPTVDKGQYISRDYLAERGIEICPDCGRPIIVGWNTRHVYDYTLGDYIDVCDCHRYNVCYCDGHHRYEINYGEMHRLNGDWYCDEAYAELDISRCPICGSEVLTSTMRTFVDDDGVAVEMCGMCYHTHMVGRIDWDNVCGRLSYSTKPRLMFYDKDGHSRECREPLSIGIEDELDQAHLDEDERDGSDADCAAREITQKYKGEVYCKYDGSLEDGSEQVTMPHSIEAFEAFDWDGMFKIASEYNLYPNSTCGFHAHINNGGLGDTRTEQKRTAAKIAMLMDMHRDFFFTLSLREERYDFNHWAGTSALDGCWESYLSRPCAACDYLYEHGYRYRAVNFTNSHTIEIRIFAATNEREIALANINVVYALVKLAKKTSMKDLFNMSDDTLRDNLIKHAYNKDAVRTLMERADLL